MSFSVTDLRFFIQCVPTGNMIFKASQHTVVVLTEKWSHILNGVLYQLQQTDNNLSMKQ